MVGSLAALNQWPPNVHLVLPAPGFQRKRRWQFGESGLRFPSSLSSEAGLLPMSSMRPRLGIARVAPHDKSPEERSPALHQAGPAELCPRGVPADTGPKRRPHLRLPNGTLICARARTTLFDSLAQPTAKTNSSRSANSQPGDPRTSASTPPPQPSKARRRVSWRPEPRGMQLQGHQP